MYMSIYAFSMHEGVIEPSHKNQTSSHQYQSFVCNIPMCCVVLLIPYVLYYYYRFQTLLAVLKSYLPCSIYYQSILFLNSPIAILLVNVTTSRAPLPVYYGQDVYQCLHCWPCLAKNKESLAMVYVWDTGYSIGGLPFHGKMIGMPLFYHLLV